MEGERELLINALQRLRDRQCLLSIAALEARLIETPYVPDSFYAYVVENLPAVLLAMQRERLLEVKRMVRMEPVRLLPAASSMRSGQDVFACEPVQQGGEMALPTKEADDREGVIVRPAKDADDPFLD